MKRETSGLLQKLLVMVYQAELPKSYIIKFMAEIERHALYRS